jgi:hypothetical protein
MIKTTVPLDPNRTPVGVLMYCVYTGGRLISSATIALLNNLVVNTLNIPHLIKVLFCRFTRTALHEPGLLPRLSNRAFTKCIPQNWNRLSFSKNRRRRLHSTAGKKTIGDVHNEVSMKLAYIEATFPELRGGYAQRTGRGEGSNAKTAISRAVGDLLKGGKGRRFTIFTAKVVVIDKQEDQNAQETS